MGRALVVFLSFSFVAVLIVLTVRVAIDSGPTVVVGLAVLVILVLVFGALGALTERRK